MTLMKCGHAPNSKNVEGRMACVICYPSPKSMQIAEDPNLQGRFAICSYRHDGKSPQRESNAPLPSSTSLAFFERRPNETYDRYYCGCWGWD